jgi:hypothetical protein
MFGNQKILYLMLTRMDIYENAHLHNHLARER